MTAQQIESFSSGNVCMVQSASTWTHIITNLQPKTDVLCALFVKKYFLPYRKLKDSIDPNVILINPSSLLNTEIDNINHEFKKMLNNLKEKLTEQPEDDDNDEDLEGKQMLS